MFATLPYACPLRQHLASFNPLHWVDSIASTGPNADIAAEWLPRNQVPPPKSTMKQMGKSLPVMQCCRRVGQWPGCESVNNQNTFLKVLSTFPAACQNTHGRLQNQAHRFPFKWSTSDTLTWFSALWIEVMRLKRRSGNWGWWGRRGRTPAWVLFWKLHVN